MHEFLLAFIGGLMIGLAAVLLMATKGTIMGISGIASKLLPPLSEDWLWRLTFIAGLFAAPIIMMMFGGTQPTVQITSSLPLLAIGGLLVGYGTVIGNGCTSGHGVCGLSRLSARSLIATGVFMLTAFATVYITRHVFGA